MKEQIRKMTSVNENAPMNYQCKYRNTKENIMKDRPEF